MTPNEFWSSNDRTRSWRFYVALCELTSALLDYATGIDLARHQAHDVPGVFQLGDSGGVAGPSRLNWASTCYYYSLVHLGCMLVFLPVGDFPMNHGPLRKCFLETADAPPRTDWLKGLGKVLRDLDHPNPMPEVQGVLVTLQTIAEFYSATMHPHCATALRDFGDVLDKAKKLRENNNYEALLIAHEYNHVRMTGAFQDLADRMKGLAHHFLEMASRELARYLETRTLEEWDSIPEAKIGFAQSFFEDRALETAEAWYGSEVRELIRQLIAPVVALQGGEPGAGDSIRGHVNYDLFSPKAGLMEYFEEKVRELSAISRHILCSREEIR